MQLKEPTESTRDMQVIVMAAQKGGCGKTTLAVHLAVHATMRGHRCLLIDMDPQQSASKWYDRRQAAEPALVATSSVALEDVIEAAKADGRTFVVIDTPPHAGIQVDMAVRLADLVLLPCKPTPVDLDALPDTVSIVRRHGRRAGVVFTSTPPTSRITGEARSQVAEDYPDLLVVPVEVGHRAAYYYALIDGRAVGEFEPRSKAALEVAALYNWCTTPHPPRS